MRLVLCDDISEFTKDSILVTKEFMQEIISYIDNATENDCVCKVTELPDGTIRRHVNPWCVEHCVEEDR